MPLIYLPHRPMSAVDAAAREGGRVATRTKRSWWSVRFTDGRIINEWDPDPGSPNGHADWLRLPKRGRQAVRLYCPNGKMAELGDGRDATGKIFQLKVGVRTVRLGPGPVLPDQQVLAHIIGILSGYNGECTAYAWEPMPMPVKPDGEPTRPDPRSEYFRTAQQGTLANAMDKWSQDNAAYHRRPDVRAWKVAMGQYLAGGAGQLAGPIDDNVYAFCYQQPGPTMLSAAVLGIDDGEGR